MKTVVLIPCYNEAKTIAKVVRDFKRELPQAEVIVFDNNSTDDSSTLARSAGATVVTIKRKGKGYVVRRMFEMAEADIYVLVDGDDTYSAKDVHKLIEPIVNDEADMVIGQRVVVSNSAMKLINRIGNFLFSNLFSFCFLVRVKDVLSGYRAFSKQLVNNVPIIMHEFQVEMELTVQSLYRGMRLMEVPTAYKERPDGSISKIHPLKDGGLILFALLALLRDLRPMVFFGSIAIVLLLSVLSYGLYVYFAVRPATLLDTVVIISIAIISWLFISTGLFLHALNRRFIELNTLMSRRKKN